VIVDNNICLHCGACVGICPPNSIFLYETSTIVFLPSCTECGHCVNVCPVGAIDFDPEPCEQTNSGRELSAETIN
jgi:ferredoxin